MRVSDLILVNHHGDVVYGDAAGQPGGVRASTRRSTRPGPTSSPPRTRTRRTASRSARSASRSPRSPRTPASSTRTTRVITEQGGAVVFEVEAGKELAAAFPTGKAAIHQNHGLFTVGETVDEAAFWFISMERSCQAQLMAMAAGDPKQIRHEYAVVHRRADRLPARRLVQLPAAVAGDLPHRPRTVRVTELTARPAPPRRAGHPVPRHRVARGAVRPVGDRPVRRRGDRRPAVRRGRPADRRLAPRDRRRDRAARRLAGRWRRAGPGASSPPPASSASPRR